MRLVFSYSAVGLIFSLGLSCIVATEVDAAPERQEFVADSAPEILDCPAEASILPCVCKPDDFKRLIMDCSLVQSEAELENAFKADFPTKTLYRFLIKGNEKLKTLDDVFNGVTFEEMYIQYSYLESITEAALASSKDTLVQLRFDWGQFNAENLPLKFEDFSRLEDLFLNHNNFTYLPPMSGPALDNFFITDNHITELKPGTFDKVMSVTMDHNPITKLEKGSFPLLDYYDSISFIANHIETIEPGAFVMPSRTENFKMVVELHDNKIKTLDEDVFGEIFPYVDDIFWIYNNPLECGCDMAWIVENPDYLSKVDLYATCADGRYVSQLDPDWYKINCH